jgi:hypothetical protein
MGGCVESPRPAAGLLANVGRAVLVGRTGRRLSHVDGQAGGACAAANNCCHGCCQGPVLRKVDGDAAGVAGDPAGEVDHVPADGGRAGGGISAAPCREVAELAMERHVPERSVVLWVKKATR